MHLFYSEDLTGQWVELSDEEARHCARVLRLKPGDELFFTDGKGFLCEARLTDVSSRSATATIMNRTLQQPRSFSLHLAVAPTKNIDRFEWFLEKATETGIEEITPLLCENSERKVIKPERLEKIMLAAMKQSQRFFLPRLNPLIKYSEFIKKITPDQPGYIAHCHGGPKTHFMDVCEPAKNALILIGPEGDFSPEEVRLAMDAGMKEISLGDARLRTETAALVACMGVNLINR